jgi:hypothetical protein
VPLKIT